MQVFIKKQNGLFLFLFFFFKHLFYSSFSYRHFFIFISLIKTKPNGNSYIVFFISIITHIFMNLFKFFLYYYMKF